MTEDKENNPNPEKPTDGNDFSKEAVEQAKKEILFGFGYKRPPQHTRFKKGQSGNPRGRPRINDLGLANERSANAIALKEGERPISVREGSDTREMPAIDAVFRKQIATALGGNAYAQKHVIERYDWAELERRQRIAHEIEIYSYYVEKQRAAIAEAKKKKEPLPDPLPHPDDIVLDPERGDRFIGPITEDGRASVEESARVRDALLMQDALDWRMAGKTDKNTRLNEPRGALVLAQIMNATIFERYRLSETIFVLRMNRYSTWSKRKLLKEVYRGWRSLGMQARRGQTIGSIENVKHKIQADVDLIDNGRHEDLARLFAPPFQTILEILEIASSQGRNEPI